MDSFEGDNSLLTIVIFCLPPWFVEIDVLLFVNDNFDGDLCFICPFPGDKVL